MKKELGYGMALAGVLAGAGALAVALMRKKKREEIYHEAELKAMNELDEMMNDGNEDEDALDCDTCSCAEVCAEVCAEAAQQEEETEETPEPPTVS